jgi:hypothetical protein
LAERTVEKMVASKAAATADMMAGNLVWKKAGKTVA